MPPPSKSERGPVENPTSVTTSDTSNLSSTGCATGGAALEGRRGVSRFVQGRFSLHSGSVLGHSKSFSDDAKGVSDDPESFLESIRTGPGPFQEGLSRSQELLGRRREPPGVVRGTPGAVRGGVGWRHGRVSSAGCWVVSSPVRDGIFVETQSPNAKLRRSDIEETCCPAGALNNRGCDDYKYFAPTELIQRGKPKLNGRGPRARSAEHCSAGETPLHSLVPGDARRSAFGRPG